MQNLVKTLIGATCLTLLASPAYAKSAPELTIENFIGTIDVVTGDYDKITVTDADGVQVDKSRSGLNIDGGYKINNARCKSSRSSVKIGIAVGNT